MITPVALASSHRPPAGPGALRRAALAASAALLTSSAVLQATIGVPHLVEDVRELGLRADGGRPRLVAHVAAGLWLGVATLALGAALVLLALWRTRRGAGDGPSASPAGTAGTAPRLVGATCVAYGAALFAADGGVHALGYVLAGLLALVGAGPLRAATPRRHD